jgi:diketogulonate reductase-like aldo/keto reductase
VSACGVRAQSWRNHASSTSNPGIFLASEHRRQTGASEGHVDRIDLYRLHWPDRTATAIEELWTAMTRLIEQGKVRAAGVSNIDVRLLDRCEAIGCVAANGRAMSVALAPADLEQ